MRVFTFLSAGEIEYGLSQFSFQSWGCEGISGGLDQVQTLRIGRKGGCVNT